MSEPTTPAPADQDGAALLRGIQSPADLRKLPPQCIPRVTEALRAEIIEKVSRSGGHLASSLGAVELLTVLHYVFNTPEDKLCLDVGHQGYAHKMLTGRRERFDDIGRAGGIGKFLNRAESPYDAFGAGHAGTSISAALGMARAFEHQGKSNISIALIGDGGMTAGMAFEALNHAGDLRQKNLLVVLNDNEMSISPNVGALSSYLSRALSAPMVRRMKGWVKEFLSSLPGDMLHWAQKAEESLKVFLSPGHVFEAFGFNYIGPVQGHNNEQLLNTFMQVRELLKSGEGPVLVHVLTAKGYGYEPAQNDPFRYHGVGAFEIESGKQAPGKPAPPKYQRIFAETLVRLAGEDERIVGITAAMADGTSLDLFKHEFPKRFYDVGIAEQHAVTFAAGLAAEGMKPVAAIYSTFLQRAYDQVVHDVCVQNLDVTFAMDRAGLVGADGATHQGLYDIAYLRTLPNMVVMAPKDENELQHMLCTAIRRPGPTALRYPRGSGLGVPLDPEIKELPVGEAELLRSGDDLALVAYGPLAHEAMAAAELLGAAGLRAAVLNARFAKPLDEAAILELAGRVRALLTLEEHTISGGFGGAVLELLSRAGVRVPVRCLALPDMLMEQGDPARQRAAAGLDAAGIAAAARALVSE